MIPIRVNDLEPGMIVVEESTGSIVLKVIGYPGFNPDYNCVTALVEDPYGEQIEIGGIPGHEPSLFLLHYPPLGKIE
jgi:hypothetical protein